MRDNHFEEDEQFPDGMFKFEKNYDNYGTIPSSSFHSQVCPSSTDHSLREQGGIGNRLRRWGILQTEKQVTKHFTFCSLK